MPGDPQRIADDLHLLREDLRAVLARVDALCADLPASAATPVAIPAPLTVPVQPSTAPLADRALAMAACQAVAQLPRLLRARSLHLDAVEATWCERVPGIVEPCPPEALARRLIELLAHVDRLGADHLGAVWSPLHAELSGIRQRIAAALGQGYRLIQANGPQVGCDGPTLPVSAPMVLATGVISADGHEEQPARCLHPAPSAPETAKAAWRLLEELQILRARGGAMPRADLDHAIQDVMAASHRGEDYEQLRNVLNLHVRLGGATGGAAAGAAVSLLRHYGLVALPAPVGSAWDPARFDVGRYQRIAAPGGVRDIIVGVRQIGFIDVDGFTIQQSILLVST